MRVFVACESVAAADGSCRVASGAAADFGASGAGLAPAGPFSGLASLAAGPPGFASVAWPRPLPRPCFAAAGDASGLGSCASAAPANASEQLMSNVVNLIIVMWRLVVSGAQLFTRAPV